MITPQDQTLLKTSKDSRELKRTALGIAGGKDPQDLDALVELLNSAEFLDRLDSAEQYQATYTSLRLASVIKGLMDNRTPAADRALLQLIPAQVYQLNVLRMQLLVRALSVVNPSPPAAVAYWDQKSQPNSPLSTDVVEALCINQSPPAIVLLERKFLDAQHEPDLKVFWMRQIILPRRNDEPLLACYERLLRGALSPELKPRLVEALFDYRPEEWYRDCSPPVPPLRTIASRPAKDILRRIGEYALANVTLDAALKAKLELAMKELRGQAAPSP